MEARTSTILEIIQRNSLLRIPYFQRRYVWEEKEWKRFAEDMESTMESERDYFLGALILKQETVSRAEKMEGIASKQLVVDGQQRLTTLAIYMKILHRLAGRNSDFVNQYLQVNSSRDPVIIHSCDDAPQFRTIMHLDTLCDIEENSNIAKAYMFFKEYLRKRQQEGVNMIHLLNSVIASVNFVSISLKQEDDEQQIFDTINSLGVPLTTGELLKNFLYEQNDEAKYKATWYQMFDVDGSKEFWDQDVSKTSQGKSPENKRIEKFLYAYVRVKMWDYKGLFTEDQRKDFVKTKNVFNTVKTFVNEFGANKMDIADEIVAYAELYRKYLSSEILEERIPNTFGIKRLSCLLNATKKETPIPYVLYILKNVQDEAERNAIFGYLEIYLVRRMLAESSSSDKSYSEFFAEQLTGQRICTYEGLKQYVGQVPGNLAMPNNGKVKMKQGAKRLDETTARIIYYLLETRLVPKSANTFNDGYNSYYAEQLMPKPCTEADAYWPHLPDQDMEEERTRLIGTLGNYFLLDDVEMKELKKIHNNSLTKKLPKLRQWVKDIRSSETPLNNMAQWEIRDITRRNNIYAEKFCNDIWPL